MSRLFIAEKPSLGRAIAQGLGGGERTKTHILCASGDTVTWCFGHMLELCEPDEYDGRYKKWNPADLPIIPGAFRKKPRTDAKAQIAVISKLLKSHDVVVNAGDPDREGQLLVDELLQHLNNRKPVQRIWLAATDDESLRKALAQLRNNNDYANLFASAEARQHADWLIGINATRAMTLAAQRAGNRGVLSVGRVQTPTLALVVQREREVRNFVPKEYFVVTASLGTFSATYQPPQDAPGVDAEGRLIDAKVAEQIATAVHDKDGRVIDARTEHKNQDAPLPHTLATLQKDASARYNMTAQQVLDTAQALYEKGLLSYPRTECPHLPDEQHGGAAAVLRVLVGIKGSDHTDPALRSKAWNTSKVEAHHGLIPTGKVPSGLTDNEQQIYKLAAERYVMQFLPAYEYQSAAIIVEIAGYRFKATGTQVLVPGWRQAAPSDKDKTEKETQTLPHVSKGDGVHCERADIAAKRTEPPARYSDGTLLEAMSAVHRHVSDPKIKARLKETSGLGTAATRASIIETLFTRGYLERQGKQIVPTQRATAVYDAVPAIFRDPGMTALWEDALAEIAHGTRSQKDFLDSLKGTLPRIVEQALNASIPAMQGNDAQTTATRRRTAARRK